VAPDFEGELARMNPLLWLLDTVITLYIWVLIASAVLSWLVAFNVVNPYNNVVRAISGALYQLTEPLLRPIRNMLPNLGGLDISPVILILILDVHSPDRVLAGHAMSTAHGVMPLPWRVIEGGVLVDLRVTPKSSRDESMQSSSFPMGNRW
jgi:YggT family protein